MENVTQAFAEMQNIRRRNLFQAFGQSAEEFSKGQEAKEFTDEQKEIIKGLRSENAFDRAAAEEALEKSEMTDIEKSDIYEAVAYNDNFKMAKTGKDIKDQINGVVLPKKKVELEAKKKEADELLKSCGTAPENPCDRYMLRNLDIDCTYKTYRWSETYIRDAKESCYDAYDCCASNATKCNVPATQEEAEARRKYNQVVDCICGIMVDIRTCKILVKNLNDTQKIDLTPRQIITFGFEVDE